MMLKLLAKQRSLGPPPMTPCQKPGIAGANAADAGRPLLRGGLARDLLFKARQRGISLIEIAVILIAFGLMAGALKPVMSRRIHLARVSRARTDVAAIRDAVLLLLNDVQAGGLAQDGSVPLGLQAPVFLAVGDGDIPQLGPAGAPEWRLPVDFAEVDFLANHLVRNRPGGDPDRGYAQWFGAYIEGPVRPDPWGNRYMVNTLYLWTPHGYRYDTVVLSAGPDGEVDSRFTIDGFLPGDDDIYAIVSSGAVNPGP